MSIGSLLINKPKFTRCQLKKDAAKAYSVLRYAKDSYFWQCWLFMLLNISMGLIIIGQCAGMLMSNGLSTPTMLFVMMLCGLSNGFGRLLFPAISDYLKNRVDILLLALAIEMAIFGVSIFYAPFISIAFVMVNATYGCFFACLPAVLLDYYGKSELSFVHGLCLQSWASASLLAFLVSTFVLSTLALSQNVLFAVLVAVYALNFANVLVVRARSHGQRI
jgi:cyanate permease